MQQKTLGQEIVSLIIPGRQFMGPIAGVERFFLITPTWTLYFEVIFYLLLPILALSAFSFLSSGVFLSFSLFGLLFPWSQEHPYFYMGFWVGALVAEIVQRGKFNLSIFKDTYSSYFILGSIILVPLLTGGELNTFSFSVASVVFFFVISGNTCFDLLLNPGARILGAVSYSIYIIHMPILFITLIGFNFYFPIAKLSTLEYAPFCLGFIFLVALISMATYLLIEKPCLVMGLVKTTQTKS
jgi:peptidoglycan/LPS O-acetylase OafA/YrhL